MNREVRGSDGRTWLINASIEWSNPIDADDFEHDVNGGSLPAYLMGGAFVVLVVLFVLWTPESVIVPYWLVAIVVIAVLFFPARWLLRRPWTITAKSAGDDEHPPETWVGVQRGYLDVRHEVAKVARHIELYAEPDMNSGLQPVE